MILVDTKIVAQLILDTVHSEKARMLLELDPEWHSEEFILVELINVLSKQVRGGYVSLASADIAFDKAASIIAYNLHAAEDHRVLETSVRYSITAYDARYITLAQHLGVPLITEDRKLRAAVPELTESLEDAIARLERA